MGSQTRQALKAFQSKNGLKQTGNLDAETKQKLNIEGASGSSAGSGTRSGKGESPAKQKESSSPMGK
jgi:peptidoglycan hydrolase-like protein with peptidoglycan-binding domain